MHNPTAEIIERVGLIPVLRARIAKQAHAVVQAMIAGGVTVVEVTMTVPGAIDLLKELKKEYGSEGFSSAPAPSPLPPKPRPPSTPAPNSSSVPAFTRSHQHHERPTASFPFPERSRRPKIITAWRAGADYVKIFPCSAWAVPAT